MEEKYEVVVVGDENDADYRTRITTVSASDIPRVVRAAAKIRAVSEEFARTEQWNRHNWFTHEYTDETAYGLYGLPVPEGYSDEEHDDWIEDPNSVDPDIRWFAKTVAPHGECGIHTIDTVFYFPSSARVELI